MVATVGFGEDSSSDDLLVQFANVDVLLSGISGVVRMIIQDDRQQEILKHQFVYRGPLISKTRIMPPSVMFDGGSPK